MAARVVGRVRRSVTSTAIAAAAMAALTASQAPGLDLVQPGGKQATTSSPPPSDLPADGNSPYHTELPPLARPDKPKASNDLPGGTGPAESGIPATVLDAYKKAERALRAERPGCNLPWQLLAAIGKVESGQARGGAVDTGGTTLRPILGPALNGVGFARITDTDGGAYDGDTTFDRAVGPMQFIPSTWATWGADGNGDGRENPNNIYDAALAAGRYLCADGKDLSVQADLERAVLSYNHSREYLRTVLSWLEFYRKGVQQVPDGTGVLPDSPGAGNRSRPAEPVTDSTTRPSEDGPGGSRGDGGKDEDAGGTGGDDEQGSGTSPSPRPTVTESGVIRPTPTPSGSESGTPTPSPTPTDECPAPTSTPTPSSTPTPTATGSASPSASPSPSGSGDPGGSGEPSPTPTPTRDADEPEETGAPEDPCGEDEDGTEDGTEDENGTGDGRTAPDGGGEPVPAPSTSGAVSGRLD